MKDFKTWFQENYIHNSGLEPSEKLCKVVDEYANEKAKALLEEAAENAQVLSYGQPIFSQSITVDKESILSLIPK